MAADAIMPNELDAYKVDFTWKKLSFLISDSKTDRQIFIGDCRSWTKPYIKFLTPDKELVGEASIHMVSIHADCQIRGRYKKIQAMKRWKTEYTYLSDAFAEGGLPVAMYWTSSSGFKHWDFILLDSNKEAVARFRSNVWAVTKIGLIEFMGNYSDKTKEEIVITGVTVYYNMLSRMNSLLQVGGAIFAKTGPLDAHSGEEPTQSVSAPESSVMTAPKATTIQ